MKLPADRKAAIKNYIMGLEYLMTEQAKANQLFAAKVKVFDKFPMFYEPGSEITMAPPLPPEQADIATIGDVNTDEIQNRLTKTMEEENNGGVR
jgi:hypothetical protein